MKFAVRLESGGDDGRADGHGEQRRLGGGPRGDGARHRQHEARGARGACACADHDLDHDRHGLPRGGLQVLGQLEGVGVGCCRRQGVPGE